MGGCPLVQLGGPVSISNSCINGTAESPVAYLFMVISLQELWQLLENASCNHKQWNPAVWTVVMFCETTEPSEETQLAIDVFTLLWQYTVYNSALLINNSYSVYRADPFGEENKCGKEVHSVHVSNCSYFPYYHRVKFPECNFHVSARESFPFSFLREGKYIGSDVNLASLIASTSGLSITWSSRPSPQTSTSGQEAHAYYENVSRNEIDLAIGGFTMNPPQICEIKSVDDIIKKNITVMISGTNDLITRKVQTVLVRKALANTVSSPGLEESAQLLDQRKDFALLERDLAMTFLINKKGYRVHSIPYTVTTLPIGLVFSKGSVFRKRIRAVTVRCVESGLCDKWIRDILGKIGTSENSLKGCKRVADGPEDIGYSSRRFSYSARASEERIHVSAETL
ncbi:unnamed protein product [Nezara viridula]|uniref:Uncharacterized protein n=1 Tax=Nezara viridula TaxID=85310 RepID=A0A9P0HAZ2_NEZVI|nr:unnamed protein product [Nezara viridula]